MKGLKDFFHQFEQSVTTNGGPNAPPPLFPDTDDREFVQQQQWSRFQNGLANFLSKMKTVPEIERSVSSFVNEQISKEMEFKERGILLQNFILQIEQNVLNHPSWANISEEENELIYDYVEKIVITKKIYESCFAEAAKENGKENENFYQRVKTLQTFIKPEYLDCSYMGEETEAVQLAVKEMVRINEFTTTRAKLISVFNCCKVISSIITKRSLLASADEFLPCLIYVLIRANPVNLYSNIEFVTNYRNPQKMLSEAGYYFTHLISAYTFVRNLEAKNLSHITSEEFNRHFPSVIASTNLIDLHFDYNPNIKIENKKWTFYGTKFEDLKVQDTQQLLIEYKQLVEENAKLLSAIKT